jgi:phospholipid/cholesterol/gamma-HCH transport system substrate-binding protein
MKFRLRRRKGRRRSGLSKRAAGLVGIVVILAICYGVYTKFANPFASPYTIHAIFPSADGINIDSPVRVAGVDVGKVTGYGFERGCSKSRLAACNAAEVTMQIQPSGLPIRDNATFSIQPRLFLEGNFFVKLEQGTPSSPIAPSGHTFPIQQGSDPVFFFQLLHALPNDTRANLQVLLAQYGTGVYDGGAAYDRSIPYWTPAFKYSAIVAHDFLGTGPDDLSTWIAKQGTVSGALSEHPQSLEGLIANFDTTALAFARENAALASAVAELPHTLALATPSLHALNRALPPLDSLARALLPGVRTSGPTIDASLPFIHQLRLLVQPAELRGLTGDLSVTVPALARLTQATIPLMRNEVRPVSSCVATVIYPWSRLTINDGVFSGKPGFPLRPVYVEAVDYLPGLAGESRDFDANGPYIRVLGEGGTLTYSLQPGLFGQSLGPITSVQPTPPPNDQRPPLEENVPCETQAPITNLNEAPGPPIKQVSSNLNAPGAKLRWGSAADALIAMIKAQAKQQGLALAAGPTLKVGSK